METLPEEACCGTPALPGHLWELLTPEQQAWIAGALTIRTYEKNEVIYEEDDAPTHMRCLMQGKVKIFRRGVGGRDQIVRMVRPGDCFGYRAHFAHGDYVNAAAAVEHSVIGLIPMEEVVRLASANSRVALFLVQDLSNMLGMAAQRAVNLTQKHIRARLADSLLFLKGCYGVEKDNRTLNIRLSREDLACLSNMITANAVRTLSQLAAEEIIALDGRKITILSEEKLRDISERG